jgi:hypothetical protein
LHHIDEDHANTVAENLAVLCLECHQKTQITGGFGRQLDAAQVIIFKADWLARVVERRRVADELAARVMGSSAPDIAQNPPQPESRHPGVEIYEYVRALPAVKAAAYQAAAGDWDTGVTGRVVEAAYRVVDVMQDLLSGLAMYYPANHFDVENPREYIAEVLSGRFVWHQHRHEPDGKGKNGTIVQVLVAGSVLDDAAAMVEQLVSALTLDWSGEGTFDFATWQREWRAASGGHAVKRSGVL